MNHDAFERLTRLLASGASRRTILRALGGLAAGGAFGVGATRAIGAQGDEEIGDLADAARAWEFSEESVEALIAALAQAGIPTFDEAGDTAPIVDVSGTASPVRLLRFQVHNLALELSARNGLRGRAIDALFPEQEGIPPVSYLLAGYVSSAQTPGGELARALMGKRSWKNAPDLIFPTVVLLLFASDLALETGGGAATPVAASMSLSKAPAVQQGGVCSSAQQFIDKTISDVFGALKIDVPENVPAGEVLEGIWNTVVDLVEGVVRPAIAELTDQVLSVIRTAAGVLAVGGMVVSLVQNWTVRLDATPARTRLGLGDEEVGGEVLARVDMGLLREWPPVVADCAQVAGVSLPELDGGGSPVRWTKAEYPVDLIRDPELPERLDDDGQSRIEYLTVNEPESFARGEERQGTLTMEARVKREDFENLKNALLDLAIEQLPRPLDQAVAAILGPTLKQLTRDIVKLKTGYGTVNVVVTYHEPPCIVGTWEVVEYDAAVQSALEDVTVAETTGEMVFTFGVDGTFTAVAVEFANGGTFDVSGVQGEARGIFNGSMSASYTEDGETFTLSNLSPGDFRYLVEAYVGGSLVSSTELTSAELFGEGSTTPYTCEGDTLEYTPPIGSEPVVLARMRPGEAPPLDGGETAEPEEESPGGGGTCDPGTTDAVDDRTSAGEESAVEIDVLANDCGAGIEISDVSPPIRGRAELDEEKQTITYTPDAGFKGSDEFTYEITSEDGETDEATVTVIVGVAAPAEESEGTPEAE